MNAILIFDPTNDLLFVKSNKLFRKRVFKYSKLNGLTASTSSTTSTSTATSATTTTTSCSCSTATYFADGGRIGNSAAAAAAAATAAFNKPPAAQLTTAPATATAAAAATTGTTTKPATIAWAASASASPPATFLLPAGSAFHTAHGSPGRHRGRQPRSSTAGYPANNEPISRSSRLRHPRRGARPPAAAAAAADCLSDTSREFLEILILLLTPYVASLRTSSLEAGSWPRESAKRATSSSSNDNSHQQHSSGPTGAGNLMNKFMSSVQINHECDVGGSPPAAGAAGEWPPADDEPPPPEQQDDELCDQEFSPRRFSSIRMPIECLSDCQIVYCEQYDHVFMYMQELELVSSFKMRLLQKRIDLFARLALILFGPSLGSLRAAATTCHATTCGRPDPVDQSRILRQVYDVWWEHQFELEFLLEANEPLLIDDTIARLCRETLHKVSLHMRRCSLSAPDQQPQAAPSSAASFHEVHMRALLFSDKKLVAEYSCRNSAPLNHDDLILLLVILQTYNLHHGNLLDQVSPSGDGAMHHSQQPIPSYCYPSNFTTNRRTQEINRCCSCKAAPRPASRQLDASHKLTGGSPASFRASRAAQRRQRCRQPLPPAACDGPAKANATTSPPGAGSHKLPSQILIFLSTQDKFKDRLRVPHMLRFIPLAHGVTLIMISEISTSYLSLQLNRALKILLEASRQQPAQHGSLGSGGGGGIGSDIASATKPAQVKLSQLAKINDCVFAIKSYFHGPHYDLNHHHHHQGRNTFSVHPNTNTASAAPNNNLKPSHGAPAAQWNPALVDVDQISRPTTGAAAAATGVSGLFNKWWWLRGRPAPDQQTKLLNLNTKPVKSTPPPSSSVYGLLGESARRLCCQLVCRLEDLLASTVHAYMGKAFSLKSDERKQVALISSTCAVLRDSLNTFVFRPQVDLLNQPQGEYMQHFVELVDQVRVLAREHLGDYLEYLAIKSRCNLTLGAPFTHDMLAIRSFVYVDRGRQQMLASPLCKSSSSAYSSDSFIDFRKVISQQPTDDCYDSLQATTSTDSGGSSESSHAEAETDRSSSSSSSDEADDVDDAEKCRATSRPGLARRPPRNEWSDDALDTSLGKTLPAVSSMSGGSRSFAGSSSNVASGDYFAPTTATINPKPAHLYLSSAAAQLDSFTAKPAPGEPATLWPPSLDTNQPLDEDLMKSFACFIYNRLANGQTSFSSSDGTYVYSYFLWFGQPKTAEVVELRNRKRKQELSHKLSAHFDSLPGVVCGDFFADYTDFLFDTTSTKASKDPSRRRRRRVRVSCQLNELSSEAPGPRARIKFHSSQIVDEPAAGNNLDQDTDDQDEERADFNVFLRNQVVCGGQKVMPRVDIHHKQQQQPQTSGCSASKQWPKPVCYELFCIHKASLLIHRHQIFVDAERLALRLRFDDLR